MKITREIIDNSKKIIHINYEDKDIEEAIKNNEERENSLQKEAQKHNG